MMDNFMDNETSNDEIFDIRNKKDLKKIIHPVFFFDNGKGDQALINTIPTPYDAVKEAYSDTYDSLHHVIPEKYFLANQNTQTSMVFDMLSQEFMDIMKVNILTVFRDGLYKLIMPALRSVGKICNNYSSAKGAATGFYDGKLENYVNDAEISSMLNFDKAFGLGYGTPKFISNYLYAATEKNTT